MWSDTQALAFWSNLNLFSWQKSFHPEYRRHIFFLNINNHFLVYKALHHRKPETNNEMTEEKL
jgi:hypothetical protein